MDACIDAIQSDWIAKLPMVLRYTGLRAGETMMLRWGDFDLDRGLLTMEASISKNKQGRIVPISPRLIAALARGPYVGSYVIPSPERATPPGGVFQAEDS